MDMLFRLSRFFDGLRQFCVEGIADGVTPEFFVQLGHVGKIDFAVRAGGEGFESFDISGSRFVLVEGLCDELSHGFS